MNLIELPLLPANAFDPILAESGSKDSVQKMRKEVRKELGADDMESFWSLGHRGRLKLDPSPLFPCLMTRRYWSQKEAQQLVHVYNDAGFEKLIHSKRFKTALKIAGKKLQAELKPEAHWPLYESMRRIVNLLSSLIVSNDDVRAVAEEMNEINSKVDHELRQVRRQSGVLVRFEGDDALVSLEVGDREELRLIDAELLRAAGVVEEESSFVLHELNWTPHLQSRIVMPAVDLDVVDPQLEQRLEDAETPLPRAAVEVS